MQRKYIRTELEEDSVFRYELLILLGHIVESFKEINKSLKAIAIKHGSFE